MKNETKNYNYKTNITHNITKGRFTTKSLIFAWKYG